MSVASYPLFLSECIVRNPDHQAGLRDDDMWGVYLSWCALKHEEPGEEQAFWNALQALGCKKSGKRVWRGCTMAGPAAVDYILSSQPSLV